MRFYVGCFIGFLSLVANVSLAHASVQSATFFGIDKDGMHLSSGLRNEKGQLVVWSRMQANAYNANGFIVNDFIPYCRVSYLLQKKGSAWHQSYQAPMRLTQTGPEYGQFIQMNGAGTYELTAFFEAPGNNFYRHIDKATGVAPWWKTIVIKRQLTLDEQGHVSVGEGE